VTLLSSSSGSGYPGQRPRHAGAPAARDRGVAERLRRRIGEVLVEQHLITEEQLQAALAAQKDTPPGTPRRRLGTVVIQLGMATEKEVAQALAEALVLPLVDLGRTMAQPEAVRLLPRAVAERAGRAGAVQRAQRRPADGRHADPTNVMALDDVKLYTGAAEIVVLVATDSQVKDHLARAWALSEDSPDMHTLFEGMEPVEQEVEEFSPQGTEARPSSGSSTWCSPTPCGPARPTCTSSRRPASCASATASTGCCATS
jgi:type IV pilus assembly protein PilB